MALKMTGAEFKRFMRAEWGPNAMWEDVVLSLNGEDWPDDDRADEDVPGLADVVTIDGGVIFPDQDDIHGVPCVDAEKFARKWLKAQATASLVVEADRDQVEAIKAALRERFGKAIKIIAA